MPRTTQFMFVIVIIFGIFFRIVNLDQKIITGDECITQLRAAGYKGVKESIQRDQLLTVEEISRFQDIHAKPSAIDTIKVTASRAPHHPPLYWLLIRFWMQVFGNSVSAIRSLSVIFSVLTLLALYWLCWELFGSAIVSWIAMALVCVSPVHIFQAHNARPYSLWILMIVISSAALMRALRNDQNQKLNWLIYGITLSLSLYTYLFSIFVVISHGIYVIIREGYRKTQELSNYLLTSGFAILSFSPWILVVLLNFETANQNTSWTGIPVDSYMDLIWSYVKNMADIFLFWNVNFESILPLNESSFVFSFGTLITVFSIYSFYFIQKHSSNKEWVFLFALTSTTVLTLMAADLLLGGRRAAIGRYLYPSILGIQITVSYLIGMKFNSSISWKIIVIALLSCGILSCAVGVQTQTWKGYPSFGLQSAQIINQASHPLVISDGDLVHGLMPLNTKLSPNVNWILVSQPKKVMIPSTFSEVFVYKASDELEAHLKKIYKLKPVYQYSYPGNFIWKAPPPSILWKLEALKE